MNKGEKRMEEHVNKEIIVARAQGILMALYAVLEDINENEHVDWEGTHLGDLIDNTLNEMDKIVG